MMTQLQNFAALKIKDMPKPINVTQVNTFQKENDELVQIFRSMNFFSCTCIDPENIRAGKLQKFYGHNAL